MSMAISFGGLSSGLDTNSIIDQLTALERQPIQKLTNRQTVLNEQKAIYTSVKSKLTDLRSAFDALRDFTLFSSTQTVTTSDTAKIDAVRTGGGAAGGYAINVTSLARAEQRAADASFTTSAYAEKLTFKVGAEDAVSVDIADGDTVDTIAQKVNSAAGMDVYASVVSGRLYFSSKLTGAANTITVTSDGTPGASLLDDMGLTVRQTGANASYTVNGGAAQTSASNVVEDAVVGVKLTFKDVGSSSLVMSDPGVDTSKVADKVQAFVDAYNATLKLVYDEVEEKPVKNATTDLDRKKGAVYSDSTLMGIASQLRVAAQRTITGASSAYDSLSDLGIKVSGASSTTSTDAKRGVLTFDKEAFKTAYAADPDKAQKLISNITGNATTEGFAQYFQRVVVPMTTGDPLVPKQKGLLNGAIEGVDGQIKLLKDRQTREEARVAAYSDRLKRQFSAMESVMAKYNQMGSSLSGQLAALR